jgi:hypothetical protein
LRQPEATPSNRIASTRPISPPPLAAAARPARTCQRPSRREIQRRRRATAAAAAAAAAGDAEPDDPEAGRGVTGAGGHRHRQFRRAAPDRRHRGRARPRARALRPLRQVQGQGAFLNWSMVVLVSPAV